MRRRCAQRRKKQWRNKCISDTYNPGSVFKMLTASMGIEEGIVNENTTFSCGGSYRVADRNIGCWKLAGHGTETFAQGPEQFLQPGVYAARRANWRHHVFPLF